MKKGKHSEEQIIGVLKQVEAGRTVKEIARELGVSEATIYTWKSKYGGMEVNEARRLKELEDANRRLKPMVYDLSPDREHLTALNKKKRWNWGLGMQVWLFCSFNQCVDNVGGTPERKDNSHRQIGK